jgi:hypothetical protein
MTLRQRLLTYRQFVNAITTSSNTLRVEAVAANQPDRSTPSTAPRAVLARLELRDGQVGTVTLDLPRGGQ